MVRPRRTSSNLGADIPGDTTAPSLSRLGTYRKDPVSDRAAAYEKATRPHSKRRKVKSAYRKWKQITLRKHTWINPLIVMVIILSAYAVNPTSENPLHKALFLSYPIESIIPGRPVEYGKGKSDFAFVAFYTIVVSFTRELIMQRVIQPLAAWAGVKPGKRQRFMEQTYTAVYFAVFGPWGLYIMSNSPLWYFETRPMFEDFPHMQHDGQFKTYYLLQASYWAQQALVLLLGLEKKRKDFKELVAHHVITLALIFCSYRFHFAYMGLPVFITHDVSDFFLATSKSLNYVDSPIVGPYFAFFIFVWIYLRHYQNLWILYATLTEFRSIGPFELNWDNQQYKCWIAQYITFSLLASLQAVNLYWLFAILRIAKNFVFNKEAIQDDRSDEEDDEQEGVEALMKSGKPKLLVNGEPMESTNGTAKFTMARENKKSK